MALHGNRRFLTDDTQQSLGKCVTFWLIKRIIPQLEIVHNVIRFMKYHISYEWFK